MDAVVGFADGPFMLGELMGPGIIFLLFLLFIMIKHKKAEREERRPATNQERFVFEENREFFEGLGRNQREWH